MKNNKTTPFYFDNTEAWGTDSFYVLGILGFFLYVLLGLTSLPSVGGSLSWREFSFVQVGSGDRNVHVQLISVYNQQPMAFKTVMIPTRRPGFLLSLCRNSVTLEAIISPEIKLTN